MNAHIFGSLQITPISELLLASSSDNDDRDKTSGAGRDRGRGGLSRAGGGLSSTPSRYTILGRVKSRHYQQLWQALIVLLHLFLLPASAAEGPPRSITSFQRGVAVTYFSSLAVLTPLVLFSNNADNKREAELRTELFSHIPRDANLLEIGFGSGNGANVKFLPANSNIKLTGLDPALDPSDLSSTQSLYLTRGISLQSLVKADAESLAQLYPPASFDCVVSTLLLCSVPDPEAILQQVARVLKPGGLYLTVEHVHSPDSPPLAFSQTLLDPLQQVVAHNCHLTRRTGELLKSRRVAALGLAVEEVRSVELGSQFPISSQVYARLRRLRAA